MLILVNKRERCIILIGKLNIVQKNHGSQKVKNIIDKYNLDGIWHFTDKSNLSLIQKNEGLLSVSQTQEKKISVPKPGGNEWSHNADRLKGVHEYVHLSFLCEHPMLFHAKNDGRINDPVWLKIDASVLLDPNVRFTCDVSNKSGVEILSPSEAVDEIDFEALFTYMDWREPELKCRRRAAVKSEILIPDFVPIEKILGCKNG